MDLLRKVSLCAALVSLTITASTVFAENSATSLTAGEKTSLTTIGVIDKNEILVSIIAANKKTTSDVADFAKMMIDQHGNNLTQVFDLLNRYHAQPAMDGTANKLQTEGQKGLMSLGGLQGDAFDKAYVDAMVQGHQAALNLIDDTLIKTGKTEDIKKFLAETRTAVAHHLEVAKKIQAEMNS